MDLKAWIVEATTGDVVTQVLLTRGSSAESMIGGGSLRAEVILAGYTNSNGDRDSGAIATVLGLVTGGRHTLLLTDGTTVVGEWLMWTHERDHDAVTVPVTGFEWEKYPQYRSNHQNYRYKNVDAGTIHRNALFDAYNTFQPGSAQMVVTPAPSFGKTMEMNTPVRTAYYSDILEDIDALGIAEWRVVPTATWSSGVPVKVTRTVTYQKPIISSSHSDRLVKVGDGRRGGNIIAFTRSHDYSRLIQSAFGWGAGKGGKQRFAMSQEFSWTGRGYIATTRNFRFQGEYKNAQLQAKTDAALAAGQDPWETTQATLDTRRMGTLPRIGGVHDVTVQPSWTYPNGGSWRMRVGQITWTYGSPFVGVQMEEV
ncbi:hypothetical protein C1N80_06150 [Brachybacterium sp. SGAir0954]|uniref:hypothetical protein n=1 Tax=Brachybacterium sp. SGAir0954 TaxID=2571029 RepID=UPI0010CD632E|nr:hypothetical protein [Brachybacterium sp. SGAir0954]QCR53202.1 hypothetical protein C1N80_06150 [Brachybacterium sp. SGAir0954]